MQTASAPETKEREIAGIITALHGDQSNCLLHVVVHNIDHALRERLRVFPPASPFELREGGRDSIRCELHCSAEKEFRAQPSENQIRVGDCQAFAFAVTDRTRIGSCTLRAYS